jgi:hypothetical protein
MKPHIWFFEKGFYKVYLNDYEVKKILSTWKDCHASCQYYFPSGKKGWDFIFPAKLYNKVAQLATLPAKEKHPNRVLSGKGLKIGKGQVWGDLPQVNLNPRASKARKKRGPN